MGRQHENLHYESVYTLCVLYMHGIHTVFRYNNSHTYYDVKRLHEYKIVCVMYCMVLTNDDH